MSCCDLRFRLRGTLTPCVPPVSGRSRKRSNQRLQQTVGHDSFPRPIARRCPVFAELGHSAAGVAVKGVCVDLFFIGVCGVFLLLGLFLARKTIYLLHRGVRTEATVVDFEGDGDGGSYPIVEYVDQSGATHRVKLSVSGRSERRESMTNIVYDADDPTRLNGTMFVETWLFPSAFRSRAVNALARWDKLGTHRNRIYSVSAYRLCPKYEMISRGGGRVVVRSFS